MKTTEQSVEACPGRREVRRSANQIVIPPLIHCHKMAALNQTDSAYCFYPHWKIYNKRLLWRVNEKLRLLIHFFYIMLFVFYFFLFVLCALYFFIFKNFLFVISLEHSNLSNFELFKFMSFYHAHV